MQPFRVAVGDLRACLERLREADILLDSVPRTAAAERDEAASDRAGLGVGVLGGVVRVAVIAAVGSSVGAPTPRAAGELAEAVALLQTTVSALEEHPAGGELQQAIHRAESGQGTTRAAQELAPVVRDLHSRLRQESGLAGVRPLANWSENDEADEAAIAAAGVGARARAVKLAVFLFAVLVYWAVFLSH